MQPSARDEPPPHPAAWRSLDVLDLAWRWGVSPWFALGLALAGFAFLAVAVLVPQAPVQPAANPTEYARWLASLPIAWQGQAITLERTGLSHIFRTAAFRLYATALGLHLCLALGDQMSHALVGWREARAASKDAPTDWACRTALPASDGQSALTRWQDALRSWGWVLLRSPSPAEERRLSPFWHIPWAALAYLGGLLMLAGSICTARWGWSVSPFALAPGQAATLQHGKTQVVVRLDALYPLQGTDSQHEGQVTLLEPDSGKTLATGPLPEGLPLRAQGLWLRLRSVDPLVTVRGVNKGGEPLGIQGFPAGAADEKELALFFSEEQGEQTFAIPSQHLSARLVREPTDRGNPRYRLELYRGTDARPFLTADLSESGVIALEEADLYLYLGWYGWFVAHSHPGAAWLIGGLLLVVAGAGAIAPGLGSVVILDASEGEGAALLAPAGRAGWTQTGFARWAERMTKETGPGIRPLRLWLDVGLLALGGAVVGLGPQVGLPVGMAEGPLAAWFRAANLLTVAGWAGLALSLGPALLPLRRGAEGTAVAETWAIRLQEAGRRWLLGGLAVGAVGNWLRLGAFWTGSRGQLWPLGLWTLALATHLLAQTDRHSGRTHRWLGGGLALAAWAGGLAWVLGLGC